MRVALAALAAAALGAAVPASAGTAGKPQLTDPAGDANLVNGQGLVDGLPDVSTAPADLAAADITAVTLRTVRSGRKVTGTSVTLTLAGAPTDPELFYRVTASIPSCADLFIEYGTDAATGGSTVRCPASDPTAADRIYNTPAAVVKGTTITWTLPVKEFPVRTRFSSLSVDTRGNPLLVTAPVIDTATTAKTFTVGK